MIDPGAENFIEGCRKVSDGTGSQNARVVDEHVQLSKPSNCRIDGMAPIIAAGDVEVHIESRLAEFGLDRQTLFVAEVTDDDTRTLCHHRAGKTRTHSSCAAGHHRNLASEAIALWIINRSHRTRIAAGKPGET